MSKIYLAGKITGDIHYKEKFKRYQEELKRDGNIVINPALLPFGMKNADYMRICFSMIDSADKICFIPDFRESAGALLEMQYAIYIDKDIEILWEEET